MLHYNTLKMSQILSFIPVGCVCLLTKEIDYLLQWHTLIQDIIYFFLHDIFLYHPSWHIPFLFLIPILSILMIQISCILCRIFFLLFLHLFCGPWAKFSLIMKRILIGLTLFFSYYMWLFGCLFVGGYVCICHSVSLDVNL